MTPFILGAILLTLAGLSCFLPLFLRRDGTKTVDRRGLNFRLHEQRRIEIATESATPEEQLHLVEDLDRALLEDLEQPTDSREDLQSPSRPWGLLTLLALIPVLAVTGYLTFGHPELLEKSPMATREEGRKAIADLAEKLQKNPTDIEGWILLGRALQSSQRAEEAVKAFEMASRLAPENPDLQAFYAEAIAEAQDGKLEGQPGEIIKDILKRNPQHKMALWLGGLAAAQAGDLGTARQLWQRLRSQLPKDSPEMREIDAYLQELGPETNAKKTSSGGAGVRVKVTLDPSIKKEASPEDVVFIFARAAEGPPMPLAVLRKTVKELPLEVTLDDRLAMRPGLEISKYSTLILGARISKTGQATPQSGDFEGSTESIQPKPSKTYSVAINRKRP